MLIFDTVLLFLGLFYFLRFKSILLKLICFIVWYPCLILFLFKFDVPLPGVLFIKREELGGEIANLGFYSYLVGSSIFYGMLSSVRNQEFNFRSIRMPILSILIMVLFFVLSSIPLLNIHSGEEGVFKSATLYICMSVFLIILHRGRGSSWFCQFIIIVILFLNGERVDSIVLVLMLVLFSGTDIVSPKYSKSLIFIGGGIIFFFLVCIGFYREGSSVTFEVLFSSIYSQRTVCDVVYIYLTAVSYYLENGPAPEVLLNLFGGLIPGPTMGTDSPYNFTYFLHHNYMPNPGGGLFCSEAYLALGFLGTPIYFFFYGYLIRKLFDGKLNYTKYIFLLFLSMQCRIIWYGLIYIYKPFVIFSVFYFMLRYMRTKNSSLLIND